ncbi:MAG: hypothetical protein HY078_14850 [Elusimicrobia bacterium]|nr:hypothetical protein [Elusimicrobiota bacterium]
MSQSLEELRRVLQKMRSDIGERRNAKAAPQKEQDRSGRPAGDPEPDREARLLAIVADRDATIKELLSRIERLQDEVKKSAAAAGAEPAEFKAKLREQQEQFERRLSQQQSEFEEMRAELISTCETFLRELEEARSGRV